MNSRKTDSPPTEVPEITEEQIERVRELLRAQPERPLARAGEVTTCPHCGGPMVTTNDLEKTIATPLGLVVLTRLPGAECSDCGALEYDAAALGIIMRHSGSEIVGDYETKVTKASGKTLGTYFKADLSRVLRLTGKEHLVWKVIDRDHVLVEIDRGSGRRPGVRRRRRRRA